MSDRDNITLRRAVVEQVRSALSDWVQIYQDEKDMAALATLDAALEAQEDEALLNEPVAMRYDGDGYGYLYIDSGSGSDWQRRHKDAEPLYLAPPQPDAKREPVAFTRKEWSPDCGEYVEFRTVEEMKFYDRTDWTPLYAAPPEPEAKREPATDAEIVIAGDEHARDPEYLLDFRDGFRAAERFHGIRKEDKP